MARWALSVPLVLGCVVPTVPVEAASPDGFDGRLGAAAGDLAHQAEQAIIAGAALLYQNRHTVSGAVLGCVAGSALGAASAAAAGLAAGGGALAGTAPAAALGCGLGAVAGAALGYPLDHLYDDAP